MVSRFRKTWAVAALMALALVACSGGGGGTVSAKEFAASVCPHFKNIIQDAVNFQQNIQGQANSSNLEDVKNAILEGLDKLAGDFEEVSNAMKDAGTPDVPNGEEIVNRATAALDDAKTKLEADRSQIEDIPTDNPQQFATQLQSAGQKIQSDMQSSSDVLGDVQSPELQKAFQQDPTCQSAANPG